MPKQILTFDILRQLNADDVTALIYNVESGCYDVSYIPVDKLVEDANHTPFFETDMLLIESLMDFKEETSLGDYCVNY